MADELVSQLRTMMEKAMDTLDDASELSAHGRYDGAASRAYYSVFHALQAVLVIRGLAYATHSRVIGAFNKEFVHTGVFHSEFSKMIDRLFKHRHIGDYAYGRRVSEVECAEDIADARKIVRAIQDYLERELGVSLVP